MDKVKVNNQIVSMRKFVKQAKIHVINKCTKQMKVLEKRKGNEEQLAKTKRKLQRLLEEVNIIKKMKPDSVSKVALVKSKDWKAVLAEKNVPLEERCFAMLANHSPVQISVEKFHSDNAELIPKIPELLVEWEKRGPKPRERFKKKQKGKKNNSEDPNTIPIKSKNVQKPNKTQITCQSTESSESLPDCADMESNLHNMTEQNSAFKEKTEDEESSENELDDLDPETILSSPAKKTGLVRNEAKDKKSYGSTSNSSELTSQQSSLINKNMLVVDKTKSNESYKNLKQSKICPVNRQINLAEKKLPHKMEAMDDNELIHESVKEECSRKLQDIRSRLLEISMAKAKMQKKETNKSSAIFNRPSKGIEIDSDELSVDPLRNLSNGVNTSNTKTKTSFPVKSEAKSKIKAVALLDLNELQDVDEIPIDRSESDSEDEPAEDLGKQKKDPFFLRDGESVSESDEDNNVEKEVTRKRNFSSFKKRPYGVYSIGDQDDNSFQKKRFEKHSKNGNFTPFKKRQNNFNEREQKDDPLQKKRFEKHSVNGRNSSFKDNNYVKNRNELSYKNNKQNFKRTLSDDSDYKQNKKYKFASEDKFRKRNDSNNFARSPKEKPFSQNHSRDPKGYSFHSKPNLSNPDKKVKDDDKPLHPSWEAKKKLKEAVSVKFQGKRMVFDD